MKLFSFIFFASLFLLVGCNSEPEIFDPGNQDLVEALEKASKGAGTSFYLLPGEDELDKIPQDPNNPLSREKVQLGKMLFHETGIAIKPELSSGMLTYSCASCHNAPAGFQAGMKQGIGEGGEGYGIAGEGRHKSAEYQIGNLDIQPLRSPSVLNSAYQKVMLWNGQFGAKGPNEGTENLWNDPASPIFNNNLGFEGVETQAIAGLGVHRLDIDTTLLFDYEGYREMFDQAFPAIPKSERYTKITAGLAIAAYERTVLANQSPFQLWLRGNESAMDDQMLRGAMLFFDKAECYTCHNGPSLANESFEAIGMNNLFGADVMIKDQQEAMKAALGRGSFTGNAEDNYKFKVPQLYNLRSITSLGHGSSMESVEEIIRYKNIGKPENVNVPENQLSPQFYPLSLSEMEIMDLTYFVEEALFDPNLDRYEPLSLPSGLCFPNNDPQARIDQGCQ